MDEGAVLLLAFIVVQRLSELALARRNTRDLLAQGAREVGAGHYPLIVALHSAWIAALIVLGHDRQVVIIWLGVFVVLQVLRVWILASLGRRWTTRIIVLDAPLTARGPFRLVRHPNYCVVVAEIAVAPLALGLPWVALVFSILNAVALTIRIRAEERALAPLRGSPTPDGRACGETG
jgi:methyltransferase